MKKNTIGEFIKNNFSQSASVYQLLIVGLAFLAISNINLVFNSQLNPLLLTIFQALGVFSTAFFMLIVLLEVITKISSIALPGLRYLVKIIKVIGDIYSLIIKFLIKKPVLLILEEKENSEPEDIIFYSEDGDWKLSNRIIKIDAIKYLELVIKPSKASLHWRIGFKFSSNEVFPLASHARNYPLLHLTRNNGTNKLRLDYYDELTQHHTEDLLENYNNEKFTVKITVRKKDKNSAYISIFDEKMEQIYGNGFSLSFHRYLMIGAWGDGNKYEFDVRQYIVAK